MLLVSSKDWFVLQNIVFLLGPYSLSVCDLDEQRGPHLKHYQIRYPDPKIGYYTATRCSFKTLEELIEHYSSNIIFFVPS